MDEGNLTFALVIGLGLFLSYFVPLCLIAMRMGQIQTTLAEMKTLQTITNEHLRQANVHLDITSTSTDRLMDFFHGRNVQLDKPDAPQ